MESASTILSNAIARNSAMVLSLPSAGMLRNHKSRFLTEDADGIWIESITGDELLIDALIDSKTAAGVSFRAGPQKISFATSMMQRKPDFSVNAQTNVPAVLLGRPTDIKAVQRRNNYRVRVVADDLSVRIWRVAEHFFLTDKPLASHEIMATVRDLSISGMGVMLQDRKEQSPKVLEGERLRVELKYKELHELILEGRLRFLPPDGTPPPIRCGVQFKKLENNLEGRQNLAVLTRIVGELQQDEVRRNRLGIKAA